jgi:hypothetical protein
MFESLFLNPAALTVGGALISAPILIHLINRMRFKRLRWAAMEFLLKSQKRNRRRLIIEQLLLLFLRCLLILLAGLLLSRFIGCTGVWGSGFEQKSNLHVVILDDTLSMLDKGKDKGDCFKTAKREILDIIVRNVSQSSTDDGILILRPSDAVGGLVQRPKEYRRLNDASVAKGLETDLLEMPCTKLNIPLTESLQRAKEIADNSTDKITLHIISDFRKSDWTGGQGKDLNKLMTELGKHDNVKKVYLIDTAHPTREPEQGGVPAYNDNLGIVEVRPSTRVASNGSTVRFTTTIVNYSPRDADVKVVPFNDGDGREISEKNYETPMPVKVPAGKTAQAIFSFPVRTELKDDGKGFIRIGARLFNAAGLPLENDGLAEDDVRHTVIEVRKTIPVLIIDGRGEESRRQPTEDRGGDSYYIATALRAVEASKYEVDFGDQLAGGDAREALELPELGNFTSILMLNVPRLKNEQRDSLERFVKDGGGVGFFMGPLVEGRYYNDELYRKGFGVFPVPIEDTFYPSTSEKALPAEFTGRFSVLLRDDQFPKNEKLPIFGPVFREPRLRDFLKFLPVQRYWPASPMSKWNLEQGQVREVANLPNEDLAGNYANEVGQLVQRLPLERDEYKEYSKGLKRHASILLGAVERGSKVPAYKLADLVESMLVDRGKENERGEFPNLVEFWDLRDQNVQDVKQEAINLRKRLLYSSPLVLTKDFGRGRVVAWMTSPGKEWNHWATSPIYAPLIFELQNYLTSQSGDSGQLVGSPLVMTVDGKRFDQNKTLKIVRKFYKPALDNPEVLQATTERQGDKDSTRWTFKFDNSLEPGFYEARLLYGDANESATALGSWGQVFNVDTKSEGNLQRVSQEELDSGFMRQVADKVEWRRPGDVSVMPINRAWDLSEWPWFFLIFIGILIAEQALAVHLSFHLRTNEAELPAAVTKPQASAA